MIRAQICAYSVKTPSNITTATAQRSIAHPPPHPASDVRANTCATALCCTCRIRTAQALMRFLSRSHASRSVNSQITLLDDRGMRASTSRCCMFCYVVMPLARPASLNITS